MDIVANNAGVTGFEAPQLLMILKHIGNDANTGFCKRHCKPILQLDVRRWSKEQLSLNVDMASPPGFWLGKPGIFAGRPHSLPVIDIVYPRNRLAGGWKVIPAFCQQ